MPIVRIDMVAGRSRQQKEEIAKTFTRELARIVHCSDRDVQIIFTEAEASNWAVGGVVLANVARH